jgi:mono/diheme cytochrome c family protein
MMPYVSCNGVRLDASSGIVVGRKNRNDCSKRDRDPYGLMPAPSARGPAGAAGLDRHAATAATTAPPTLRNQRRERDSLIRANYNTAMRKSGSLLTVVVAFFVASVVALAQSGWTIPAAGREEKSPLQPTADVLKKGASVYKSKCQRCHGKEAKGDGPESDPDGPAADLTDDARASVNPDGVLFYKIWNGRSNPKMPAFKSEMAKDDVWSVVEYVKSLRKS